MVLTVFSKNVDKKKSQVCLGSCSEHYAKEKRGWFIDILFYQIYNLVVVPGCWRTIIEKNFSHLEDSQHDHIEHNDQHARKMSFESSFWTSAPITENSRIDKVLFGTTQVTLITSHTVCVKVVVCVTERPLVCYAHHFLFLLQKKNVRRSIFK